MATTTQPKTVTVALIGNPNTGKSTLFNALAGVRQRVGNYPGVTVEKKLGRMQHEGKRFELVDLPGTYSLAPRSPDEMVAVDVLLGRRSDSPTPDLILSIVDASNLERNLYLVSQLLELGRPMILALNMTDVAASHGVSIDVEQLSTRLGVPVIPLEANRRRGITELKAALLAADEASAAPSPGVFPEQVQQTVTELREYLESELGEPLPRYLVERLLVDVDGYIEAQLLPDPKTRTAAREELAEARRQVKEAGHPVPAVEAISRYGWVQRTLEGVVQRPTEREATPSDRIDRVLTHWFSGTFVFAALMFAVFCAIFIVADPLMGAIDEGVGWFGEQVGSAMSEGPLQSLIVDGIIGGVGAVVVFLPQILILFLFIAILEDCGYMARAAYLMDRLLSRVGLSGKSFIPLLSSFACAVPGIMAARVIENRRDRLTTILVAPLMSCSARLPVYIILITAFIPQVFLWNFLSLRGLVMFAMYLVGVVTAVLVALALKKTLLPGATPPFVMELPSYKFPSPATVLHRMGDRGWAFIRRAGTIIFAVTIIVWAATYYPRNEQLVEEELADRQQTLQSQLATADDPQMKVEIREDLAMFDSEESLDNMRASIQQRHSVLGTMGRFIEPVVRPLGWDWRIGCAAIASFPAREVVIGVLGVIYNLGEIDPGEKEDQSILISKLRRARHDHTGELVYNVPVALSIMVFFALCAQCAATLAVIRRETNSWGWPVFTFTYMTVLAYIGALATYQIGMLFV